MIAMALRAVGLAAIYLLVLTSIKPGDIVTGAALGLALALALAPRQRRDSKRVPASAPERVRAAAIVVARTGWATARGSWEVARFCLGSRCAPGFVEIPRAGRSRMQVGVWALLTGETPDEYAVHVDEERDVLTVHVLDASDPEAVRERHRRAHERWQSKAVS